MQVVWYCIVLYCIVLYYYALPRNVLPLTPDIAMKGHVISTVLVASPLTCSHACLKNNNCKSINYQHVTNTGRHLCELNSVTRDTHPGDLRPREGYLYYQDVLPNEVGWVF